jgi:hypothetical protein
VLQCKYSSSRRCAASAYPSTSLIQQSLQQVKAVQAKIMELAEYAAGWVKTLVSTLNDMKEEQIEQAHLDHLQSQMGDMRR